MVVEGATSPLNDPGPVLLGAIVSEKKIVKEKFFFPWFPLNSYNSAPIGPICTQKIWAARRALSTDPVPVLLGAIFSEKKIVKEKCFFPLFPLKRYNSAPIGPICIQKIWAARRVLSNDQGPVLLGAIVSEKKIVKEKSRLLSVRSRQKKCGPRGRDESFPMIKLGSYWSDMDEKNVGVEGATSPFQ
ncbi:LOW QUALITY PROTEIN: hypothetical protein V1477_006426 [Vespula maculifrons]|uniref:Uncharacterized protein n=1 Tax=Vespula maculifrons TaxID=7453 RepID=A0ABD2CKE4_VESMC